MNFKLFLIPLLCWDMSTLKVQKDPVTHKGYLVCGESVKRGSGYSIRIEKQFAKSDTTYSRLYFHQALAGFGSEFYLLKFYRNKYLIASDFRIGGQHRFYEFFDLSAKIGSENKLESLFFYSESTVILKAKRYSKVLKDTLVYYDIRGNECPAHGDCVSEFVFARNLGFVRLSLEPKGGCIAYFFPINLVKDRNRNDTALRELFVPITKQN